ncbi:secreted protein [gut metagenome]|uniref:Secreted protein n=1 Tax=gut metagenome TaxID=749906 RepID=J9G762_9ZZZZ
MWMANLSRVLPLMKSAAWLCRFPSGIPTSAFSATAVHSSAPMPPSVPSA